MKKSVFSAAKLAGLTAVNRGTKSSNDIRPAITTARGMNKFTMNASASALIGCGHGDRVVMFAMPNADSINERFFIALSAGSEGCKLASAGNTKGTGRPQSFNYAGVWSQMLMQDKDAAPVGERVLADKGLMEEVETQKGRDGKMCTAVLATKRVEYGVEEVKDEEGEFIPVQIDDTIYEKVYVLVDPKEVTLEDEKQTDEPQPEIEVMMENDKQMDEPHPKIKAEAEL